jgi:hypothetical protein
MTPESRNSPLLDNGSLTQVSMEVRIRGDRLGMERAFHVNGLNNFHEHAQATNIFHGYALKYENDSAGKIESVVREFSVRLWSVSQRKTEAEEVTDS